MLQLNTVYRINIEKLNLAAIEKIIKFIFLAHRTVNDIPQSVLGVFISGQFHFPIVNDMFFERKKNV